MSGISITVIIFVTIALVTFYNFYGWKKKN